MLLLLLALNSHPPAFFGSLIIAGNQSVTLLETHLSLASTPVLILNHLLRHNLSLLAVDLRIGDEVFIGLVRLGLVRNLSLLHEG